jgi:hypothetical protein
MDLDELPIYIIDLNNPEEAEKYNRVVYCVEHILNFHKRNP